MRYSKKIFCLFFTPLLISYLYAQKVTEENISISELSSLSKDSNDKVYVRDIKVKGVRKTKIYIVFREIQFKKGDSLLISQLARQLEQARQQIYNTSLFNEVKINTEITSTGNVNITVNVKERWYIYPVPQFQLVDRNFNEWYKTYHASFNRVNYGLKFVHYNVSGRRDQLRMFLINGYARNISFSYTNPYSNSLLNEGFSVGAGYSQSREITYKTDANNNILQYKQNDFIKNIAYGSIGYTIRKGFFKRHTFSAGYTYLSVDDSILNVKYNPNYFNGLKSSVGYVDLSYLFQYTDLNNNFYPLKGQSGYILFSKRIDKHFMGGVNVFAIEGGYNIYFDLNKKWYASFQAIGKLKLPFNLAYINQRGLGYGENYLRGLEYYVIDGIATMLLKSTLKKKIAYLAIPFPFKSKTISKIPFTIFAKTFADLGYAYNAKKYYSYLNNRLLYTGGFGIDVLTLYDINIRFEYSFNQLKQNGLFLHNQSGF